MADIFTRSALNPILSPNGTWWKVYNPGAAIDKEGSVHLFPRVVAKEKDWHSRIAHAISPDGEKFEWAQDIALERILPEEPHGVEDPRVVAIDGHYDMTFASYDGKAAVLQNAVADSLDGPWRRLGLAVPEFRFIASGGTHVRWEGGTPVEHKRAHGEDIWSKSGSMFPEKINGTYRLLFGEYHLWLASSEDGAHFIVGESILEPRKGTALFDNTFIEMGPPPILTDKGWLLLYHGIDEAFRYQLGFCILDREDPAKILYRSEEPIFGPREPYEIGDNLIDVIKGGVEAMLMMSEEELKLFYKQARQENVMPQVTFVTGAVLRGEELWLYYGAGDTTVCAAHAPLADILKLVELASS